MRKVSLGPAEAEVEAEAEPAAVCAEEWAAGGERRFEGLALAFSPCAPGGRRSVCSGSLRGPAPSQRSGSETRPTKWDVTRPATPPPLRCHAATAAPLPRRRRRRSAATAPL
ncbi:unnamed protein product [Merluccius merluccius]